jgi:chloramphenicol-sensitive protein RarD
MSDDLKNGMGRGFAYAIPAFTLWGILPLYWRMLSALDSLHILALRILVSLVVVAVVLLVQKKYSWLVIFRDSKKRPFLFITGLVLCFNWGFYIWAVNLGHTFEASLGYYINPLVSVVLGLVFYRERLGLLKWTAVAVAFTGILLLTLLSGSIPWISLVLAVSFGFYGLLKKKVSLAALESLGAETLVSAPIGLLLLLFGFGNNGSGLPAFYGLRGLGYFADLPARVWLALPFIGILSSLPLYGFAHGAKLLPLSALGFVQFISPTIQFAIGFFVFGEYFPARYFFAFGCIWLAVIIYIFSLRKRA